ncbi:MAG: lytic transglycosylase domain-containing protein [Altererythrobacter sp.]|nr:lytic transglycosylase domain-containing protein [Altererythrobacter sp.]
MWFATIGRAGAFAAAVATAPCAAQGFELFAHDHSVPPRGEVSSEPPGAPWMATLRTAGPRPSFRESLYLPMIREAEVRYRLPTRLLQALIWAESRFDPLAISPAGAAGLAQLMPATARELGVINRHDPAQSIDGGARYLRQMLDRFGAIHLALAAYNAGPGAVERAGGIPRNRETPGYVRSVLNRWSSYRPS